MTLLEFAKANTATKLSQWQIDFLKNIELAYKEDKVLIVNSLPRSGRTHLINLINKYYTGKEYKPIKPQYQGMLVDDIEKSKRCNSAKLKKNYERVV